MNKQNIKKDKRNEFRKLMMNGCLLYIGGFIYYLISGALDITTDGLLYFFAGISVMIYISLHIDGKKENE